MEPLVYAYWTPKLGNSDEEYEDAFAYSANHRHFAIADGATESSYADRWARGLVQKYLVDPPAPGGGKTPLRDWIKPLQGEWHRSIPWEALPWFAEEKARVGAFATFLGISFASEPPKKGFGPYGTRILRRSDTERMTWRAFAVGDSCVFHVRRGVLVQAFPVTKAEQFNSRPTLLSSNPNNNNAVWDKVETAEGDCSPGDLFFAMTDALAHWFLAESEAGREPWLPLLDIESPSQFRAFVEQLRGTKALRNDDTTLLRFQWLDKPAKGRTSTLRKSELRG